MRKRANTVAPTAAVLLAAGCGSHGAGSPDLATVPYGPVQVPPLVEVSTGPGSATRSPAAPTFAYRLQQAFTLSERNGVGAAIVRFRLTAVRFGVSEVRDLVGGALLAQLGSSRIDPLATRQVKITIDFDTLPAEQMTAEFDFTDADGLTRPVSVQLLPEVDLGRQESAVERPNYTTR